MNISKKLIYLFATVLTAVLSVGCTQSNGNDPDDPGFEEGIPTEVRITLSANPNNATRADQQPDGTPKDPTSSVELIHNWWIVFVDKKGNVKIIRDTDIPNADKIRSIPSSVALPDNGFEAETFKTILPSGTYRIYAFANIPPKDEAVFKEYLQEKDGKWIHKTIKLKEILGNDGFMNNSNLDNNKMQWAASVNIPMSGVMTNKVIKNTVEEAFNIEVIRAVAKVEFVFKNPSDDDITLKKLDFSPISKYEKISFVPNNDSVGFGYNNKLITDKVETGVLSFDLGSTKLTADNQSYSFSFYCNESLPHDQKKYITNQTDYDKSKDYSDLYTKHFTIELTVEKKGIPLTKKLETSAITYINRNDWILIPISVMQYDITAEAIFYPPIGGYPAMLTTTNPDGSQVFTFGTEGDFAIVTKVYDKFTGTHLAPKDYSVALGTITGDDIFDKAPTLIKTATSLPDEIIGTLYSTKGKATIEIKVTIGKLTHTIPIYIIRE